MLLIGHSQTHLVPIHPEAQLSHTRSPTPTPTGAEKAGRAVPGSQALEFPGSEGEDSEAGESVPGRKRGGREGTCVSLSFHKLLTDGNLNGLGRKGGGGGRSATSGRNREQPWMGGKPLTPQLQTRGWEGGGSGHAPTPRRPCPEPLPGVEPRKGLGQAPCKKAM